LAIALFLFGSFVPYLSFAFYYCFFSKSYTVLYPFGYIILSLSLAKKQTRIAALVHEYNLNFASLDKMQIQKALLRKADQQPQGHNYV